MSMFPSTLPMDDPDSRLPLARAAARPAAPGATGLAPGAPAHTALSSLSPSLLQDLQRFDDDKPQRELLEVLAAGVRHTQPLAIALAWEQQTLTLSVFPTHRLVHCPLPMAEFLAGNLEALQVRQVQPATLRPPGSAEAARIGNPALYAPLAPLLWAVALRGSRDALLPELAGNVAYRIAPGANLDGLALSGSMLAATTLLRRDTTSLRTISQWQGFDRERAQRMLNGLYLQAGLMVSRTHPAATNEGWFSGSR